MIKNDFEVKTNENWITLKKGNSSFEVAKGQDIDSDIWFFSQNRDTELTLNLYSSNDDEIKAYNIFYDLMKRIIGRYYLDNEDKNRYSFLPKDFISTEDKTITWHSDSNINDILQFKHDEHEITISISKDKNDKVDNTARVRIRTSGSSYEYYYQEFLKLYRELLLGFKPKEPKFQPVLNKKGN